MSDLLALSQSTEAILTLVVVAVMFLLFIREVYPPEVTAIAGAAAMLVLGVLPYLVDLRLDAEDAVISDALVCVVR